MSNTLSLQKAQDKLVKWNVSYGMWRHGEVEAPCRQTAMEKALEFFGVPVDKYYLISLQLA